MSAPGSRRNFVKRFAFEKVGIEMERIIKTCPPDRREATLDFVERVFAEHKDAREGKMVRSLVAEIRSGEFYVPELDLIAVDAQDEIIGCAMFSRFPLEGRHADELLLLSPVAVKTELQRQHISKDMLEFGFERAKRLGFRAILVEGDPRNYNPRGFRSSFEYGIVAGPALHLPSPDCLMVRELADGALREMRGRVDFSLYEALRGE